MLRWQFVPPWPAMYNYKFWHISNFSLWKHYDNQENCLCLVVFKFNKHLLQYLSRATVIFNIFNQKYDLMLEEVFNHWSMGPLYCNGRGAWLYAFMRPTDPENGLGWRLYLFIYMENFIYWLLKFWTVLMWLICFCCWLYVNIMTLIFRRRKIRVKVFYFKIIQNFHSRQWGFSLSVSAWNGCSFPH